MLTISKIDEVTAKGCSIYFGNRGIDIRRLDKQWPTYWGWWLDEGIGPLYITTKRWMITIG